MPVPIVNIKFDQNDHRVYYSGQTLSGRVEVSCSKAKAIKSISVQVTGYAKTFWDNTFKLNCIKRHRPLYYDNSGREEYLSKHAYILGSVDGEDEKKPFTLTQGAHKYEFSFDLPLSLPSSFEGTYGYIRYMIKAIIDRPQASIQTSTERFSVINTYDLNEDTPVLKLRAEVETVYESGCFCCLSKPFNLKASIPQTGLVTGQIIPIRTVINNACNLHIFDVKFSLRKIIAYSSNKHTVRNKKKQIFELVNVSSGFMLRKGCNKFEEYLAVPKTQSTTSDIHSGIIQIDYDIKVECVVHAWHKNPFVVCPITIGTVPLKDVVQNEILSEKNNLYFENELQPLNDKVFRDANDDFYIEFIDEANE